MLFVCIFIAWATVQSLMSVAEVSAQYILFDLVP